MLVGQKTAAVVALSDVRKEDVAELELLAKNCMATFNNNVEIRKQ